MFQADKKPILFNKELSGGIVTFNSRFANMPVSKCKITIPISQKGSGTPSPDNIREFIDVSGVQLFQGGSDLLGNTSFESGTILTTDGGTEESSGYITYDFIDVSNMSTIAIRSAKEATAGRYFRVCGYDSSKTFTTRFVSQIRRDGEFTDYFDVSGVDYIRICWANNTTLFEAYNGDIYTISFGQSIYSGVVDIKTGKLFVTSKVVDLGDLEWRYGSQVFYTDDLTDIKTDTQFTGIICECFETIWSNASLASMTNYSIKRGQNSTDVYIKNTDYTSASDFTTAFTDKKIVYELAEPIEVILDGHTIEAVKGVNNIFANIGTTTVGYVEVK